MQRVDFFALDAAVHVVPFAHLLSAVDVVVGHIHAAGVGDETVDDDNLAVVSGDGISYPRKTHRGKGINLNAAPSQAVDVVFLQGAVVGCVAESIVECAYLHALLGFHGEEVEEQGGDGVVAEVEVFEMNAASGLPDGLEHVVELSLPGGEQCDGVVSGEGDTFMAQVVDNERIDRLGLRKSEE